MKKPYRYQKLHQGLTRTLTALIVGLTALVAVLPAGAENALGSPEPATSPANVMNLAPEDGAGSPLINDAFPPSQTIRDLRATEVRAQAGSHAPGSTDTSVYMNGTVAVGIILPESNGSGENWTVAEKNAVVAEIQTGMDWWESHASPASNLNFVYDLQLGIATTVEPIQQNSSSVSVWIKEVLGNLGYAQSTADARVLAYDNHIRDTLNTTWAFTIFVVDSSADVDGKFSDGSYFAWAYLGGPYMVMTYDNDGWGISNMNWVAAHETGHIFLAGDQYYQENYGGCTSLTERYGYLGVANSNCEYNNPNSVPSIMRSNENALDATAAGQIGWRDSNSNSIPDTIDTNPALSLSAYTPDPTVNSKLTYTGNAYDIPWPHAVCAYPCYHKDVDINIITAVDYRVDSGAWVSVPASDGTYDLDSEDFTFTTNNLNDGLHSIDVRATNSIGRQVTWSDTVTVNSPYTLTVSKTGSGDGTVTSVPAGINCGASCSANFDQNASVTLSAAGDANSAFTGWSGEGCSGTGNCVVTMSAARSVTANFDLNQTCYTLTLTPGTGGSISADPVPNCNAGTQYTDGTIVSLTPVPTSSYYRFLSWGGDLSGSTNPQNITMSAAHSVSASFEASTFVDVPFDYSETLGGVNYLLYPYIEALWDGGYTAGCVASPLTFCPALTMDRAMSSVFMLRGQFGSTYTPPDPPYVVFTADNWALGPWAQPFAEGMWLEGLTAGCQQPADNPQKLFCPWDVFTRAQAAVFGLRLMYGMDYGTPTGTIPVATGLVFADLTDTSLYPTAFAEAAYAEGLLTACGTSDGKPLFCPDMAVDRAWAAYVIAIAKSLPLP